MRGRFGHEHGDIAANRREGGQWLEGFVRGPARQERVEVQFRQQHGLAQVVLPGQRRQQLAQLADGLLPKLDRGGLQQQGGACGATRPAQSPRADLIQKLLQHPLQIMKVELCPALRPAPKGRIALAGQGDRHAAFFPQLGVGLKEDAADLEERHIAGLAIRIVPERVEQPGLQTWPQHVHIAAQRVRQANRKNHDVALFEIGRVFLQSNAQSREERRLAIALTGQRNPPFWSGAERGAKFDLHDLKGMLEEFLDQIGARGLSWTRRAASTALLLESATIELGKQTIGELGQLLPSLARQYDLREAVLLAELNLDSLLARRAADKSFKPLPAFPAIRRDVAMLVPEATTHAAVLQAVKQARPRNLESVELFDVFRGKNVPAGQKSVAYAFIYRNPSQTLTDAEVNAAHQQLVEQLKRNLQAVIRE